MFFNEGAGASFSDSGVALGAFEVLGIPPLGFPSNLPPGDAYCAAGVNGPGNIYDPFISSCLSGIIVPDGDAYCAAGLNGPGYLYDPFTESCLSGIVVLDGDAYCAAGANGPGSPYDPFTTYCESGVVVLDDYSYCAAGTNGPGGQYNPATEGCNAGVTSPLGALPTVVQPNQVATTASGLTYNRVSQTFKGTVTIRNIGSNAVSGPLQIVFTGLPANVTLVNASGSLSGSPYVTVPAVASLAIGQSVAVSVQFNDASNASIKFSPVIYSGSI
jgi:hypothetical protein